jgi:hypothetical protein
MANDMQWPSEDEDFDATTDAVKVSSFNNAPEKLVAKPVKKPANRVAVAISEPDVHQVQETPDEIDQAFAEPVEHREEITPEAPAEPEEAPQEIPEPAPQAPVARKEAPVAAAETAAVEHTPDLYEHVSEPARHPKSHAGMLRAAVEVLLVLALIGVSYYAYTLSNDKKDLKSQVSNLQANTQLAIQTQTDDLISTVGSLMTLPTNETPTVANVSDAAKAKQQSNFFANAQNGDKVLMYVKAGQAILFRPSTSKIILVAPLTFNSDTAASTAKPTSTTAGTTTTTKTTR